MGIRKTNIIRSVFLPALLTVVTFGAQTGKIRGVISEKTTGKPLIGVNVLVEGTTLGSATDVNGEYFILQIPPDVYSLQCRMIGYRPVSVIDVKVMTDHTTKIDVVMESEAIDLGEVVVVARQPIIQKDVTTSTQFIDAAELKQLPFTEARDGLMVQTGVFMEPMVSMGGMGNSGRGEARYAIRGGGQEEVKWFVDGIRTSSLTEAKADRGGSFTGVNMHAIQEVQIIMSGFNAEYGEAQSGIVNVVTKEGGEKITGSFEYIYGVPGQHHFGNYVYSKPTISKYLDHADEMTATYGDYFNGRSEEITTHQDSAFIENLFEQDQKWWSKYQKEYWDNLADTTASYWSLDTGYKFDWSDSANTYRHQLYEQGNAKLLDPEWDTDYRRSNTYDYRKIPDYTVLASLGGPLFNINGIKGSFFIASKWKQEAYRLPRPTDSRNTENLTYNFSFRLSPKMKLRYSGMYNHESHSTWQEQAEFLTQVKYYRGWGSVLDTYISSNALHWNHSITNRLFYDLKLSYYQTDFKEKPSEYTVIGESNEVDLWGYQRYEKTARQIARDTPVEAFDRYARQNKSDVLTSELALVGSLNWQLNSTHFLKSGFEARYHTYSNKGTWSWPSYTRDPDFWWNRSLEETYHPIQLAIYIQDKMEFESMILNFGLRYDRFDPNYNWFKFSTDYNLAIDPLFSPSLDPDGDQLDENGRIKYGFDNILQREREPAAVFDMISPRLGVSFPITEMTVLHFNYGHFYQVPPLSQMFEMLYWRPESILKPYMTEQELAQEEGREPNHIPSPDGDPERAIFWTLEPLKPEKTITFEVGVKHSFNDKAVLELTAFYKDAFDKTEPRANLFDRRVYAWNPYRNQVEDVQFYVSLFPGDYGDSRGFEVTFRTLFSQWMTFDMNYSYSVSTIGRASPGRIEIARDSTITYTWDVDVNLRIPVQNSYSRPHIVRTNLYLHYPDDLNLPILTPILRGTSASILYSFVSGQPFTYLKPTDPPDIYDNYRYPATHTVDLRLEKGFKIGNVNDFTAYIQIKNLLNRKNLVNIGDVWFLDPDQAKADYIENGTIANTDDLGYDISWCNYAEPRRINFGIRYNFK